jgi:uncharacterized protein (TIGR00251 family)
MMSARVITKPQGLSISVKVVTGASKTAMVGVEGDFVKIRLAAPPVDGKANQELIDYISKLLSVPKSKVHIQSGLTSRRKVILVEDDDGMKLREILSGFE